MGKTFYPQAEHAQPKTMTVGDLMRALNSLDPNLPVIFKSPELGAFGPNSIYTIDGVATVSMPAREEQHAGGRVQDEETGEWRSYPAWTDRWLEWNGVIIS